jgi:hypothetical protein
VRLDGFLDLALRLLFGGDDFIHVFCRAGR